MNLVIIGLICSCTEIMPMEEYPASGDTIISPVSSGNIIFEETFETPLPFFNVHQQFAMDHGFSITSSPVFQGKGAGRFELRATDDMVANGTRAEVLFPEQKSKERWYSFWVYLPSDYFENDSYREIISQWHQGGGAGSPPNSLQIKDDKFLLKSVDGDLESSYYELGDVIKDEWQEFVFHFVHSIKDDGLIEIWHNNKKVLTLKGVNMKAGFEAPRWKIGIYKWKWNGDKTTDTDLRVLYYDNVRMGNEHCTYEEICSYTPDSQKGPNK